MSSPRGSRPTALSRRSALSLREGDSSPSSSSMAHVNSLADELIIGGSSGAGSGARSLAEEFGLDLGDDEDEEEGEREAEYPSRAESPSKDHLFDHDPQFANHDDFEPDPFSLSISQEFGNDEGSLHDQFGGEQEFGELAGAMSLGDELTLGDEFATGHEQVEDDEYQQTPTRPSAPRRVRSRTASTFRNQRVFSGLSHASSSSSRSSSPPSRLRSASASSHVDVDEEDSDSDSPAPQRLFSSSSIPSTPSTAPSSTSVPAETILLPPTFLPLLAQDDRSFELEHATAAVVRRVEDIGRQREGMCRELAAMERELGRLIAEGVKFYDPEDEESEDGQQGMGTMVEDEEDEDEDDSLRSFDEDDDDRTGTARPHQLLPAFSPSRSRNTTPRKSRPPNPFGPPLSRSSPSSPSSRPPPSPSVSETILPSLSALTDLTTSLLTSLSSLHDQSQITLSSAADAGRRLRALKATLATTKAEEDGLERAWAEVMEWEERKAQEGESVGRLVEREMDGFRRGVEEFEERTKGIRDEHQRFLVGVA